MGRVWDCLLVACLLSQAAGDPSAGRPDSSRLFGWDRQIPALVGPNGRIWLSGRSKGLSRLLGWDRQIPASVGSGGRIWLSGRSKGLSRLFGWDRQIPASVGSGGRIWLSGRSKELSRLLGWDRQIPALVGPNGRIWLSGRSKELSRLFGWDRQIPALVGPNGRIWLSGRSENTPLAAQGRPKVPEEVALDSAGYAASAIDAHLPSEQRSPLISAAYPAWRASAFPPEEIPFEYLHQIGHFSVQPGEHGALAVPPGFVMPELIELAHQAGTQVILVVGGANSYGAFASMAADPDDRATFVQNLTGFVVDQGYDGLNIDWEFPRTPADRQNLVALMQELRAGLDATGRDLQLSIAVTSNEQRGQWIDVEAITPLVHHYLVMTFGYHGAWGPESGHNAPLYSPPQEGHVRSVDQSLRYWTEARGVPAAKVVMGVASFGIWFDSEGLYEPFTATQKADYRDIEALVGKGYTVYWDDTTQVPYLTRDSGPGLWSYDDPRSVGLKRDYLLANGLGGVGVWDVTMDRVDGEHKLLQVLAGKLPSRKVYLPLVQREQGQ